MLSILYDNLKGYFTEPPELPAIYILHLSIHLIDLQNDMINFF